MKYSLRKMFSNERGNFGHKGRPGKVGGSQPSSSGKHQKESREKRKEVRGALGEAKAFDKMLGSTGLGGKSPFGSSTSVRRGDDAKGSGKYDIGAKVTPIKSIEGLKEGSPYQVYDKGVATTASGKTYKYYKLETLTQGRTDTVSIGSPSLDPDTVLRKS